MTPYRKLIWNGMPQQMMHLPLCDKLSLGDLELRNELRVNQFDRILLLILHSRKRFDNTKILSQSTLLS